MEDKHKDGTYSSKSRLTFLFPISLCIHSPGQPLSTKVAASVTFLYWSLLLNPENAWEMEILHVSVYTQVYSIPLKEHIFQDGMCCKYISPAHIHIHVHTSGNTSPTLCCLIDFCMLFQNAYRWIVRKL